VGKFLVTSSIIIALANVDRAQDHLPALQVDPRLMLAAQEKADDMAAKDYFAHVSPDGKSPWYWFSHAGYDFRFAGENLAVGFSDADGINSAWMGSALHRANILDVNYTEIGVATATGMYEGMPTIYVAEEFGSPK